MTITIEKNVSFGQLYLVEAETKNEIRIGTKQADQFIHATGIDDVFPATYHGKFAQNLWIVAQKFGHEV